MKKWIGGAVLAAVVAMALWYAWNRSDPAPGVAVADSVAKAERAVLEEVYAGIMPQIRRWRDSAAEYRARYRGARRQMREAEVMFNEQMQALLATADTGTVRAPQLIALREVHVKQVRACRKALEACERRVSGLDRRLTLYRDSLVPALKSSNAAERRLVETLKADDPDFFGEFVRCLPEVASKVGAVAGAFALDERVGVGAAGLFGVDLAFGGPC